MIMVDGVGDTLDSLFNLVLRRTWVVS